MVLQWAYRIYWGLGLLGDALEGSCRGVGPMGGENIKEFCIV